MTILLSSRQAGDEAKTPAWKVARRLFFPQRTGYARIMPASPAYSRPAPVAARRR
ncbi:MAG: hypothetical protein ACK5MQ_09650 [Pikeienuella sp.]